MLENYTEDVRGIEFKEGDVVEVLDTEKADEWLVRKQNNKEEVRSLCTRPVMPVSVKLEKKLKKKKKKKKKGLGHSKALGSHLRGRLKIKPFWLNSDCASFTTLYMFI